MCDEDLVKQPNYLLLKCQGETRRTVFISTKHFKNKNKQTTDTSQMSFIKPGQEKKVFLMRTLMVQVIKVNVILL